jgi:hypothetical protein
MKDFSKNFGVHRKNDGEQTLREKALIRLENSKHLWQDPAFVLVTRKRGGVTKNRRPTALFKKFADGSVEVSIMVGRVRVQLDKKGSTMISVKKDEVLEAHDFLIEKLKTGDYDKELEAAALEAGKALAGARVAKGKKAGLSK